MFSAIYNTYKKSEAAATIQGLLERASWMLPNPAAAAGLANDLVGNAWNRRPERYSGQCGRRPHRLVLAAVSLAEGIQTQGDHTQLCRAYAICLGQILSELAEREHSLSLGDVDRVLIGEAMATFRDLQGSQGTDERLAAKLLGRTSSQARHASFESWYADFKREAGLRNPQLAQSDGLSLIDLMDHKPLQLAFQHGKDPVLIAREFAASFDIRQFGSSQ